MAAGAIGGAVSRHNKNKQLSRLIKKSPKYKIADEAYDNQNLAKAKAFGRSRAVTRAEQQLDQDQSNAAAGARDITSSTSDLLSTISALNAQKATAQRSLAMDENAIQDNNAMSLYAANQAMIDEKDKKFKHNKVDPWQNKIAHLNARKEEANSAWGSVFQAGTQLMGSSMGGGGGMGGSMGGIGGGAMSSGSSAASSVGGGAMSIFGK